jgi:signal transduction histidine kinase
MAQRVEEVEEELRSVIARQDEEIKRGQEQLVQQEKMAALGLLAAGVAHEIGNPLTAVSSIAQLLHHRTTDESVRKQTALILTQIDRISRIVREMTDFARPRPSEVALTDLNELLRGALQLARYDRRTKEIRVETDLAMDLPSLALVQDQIFQVLFNLILNAIDAMPSGGTLTLRSRAGTADRAVVIEVEDTGTGIPQDHLGRIFEPFFTTKRPGAGTGLGLSLSYGMMQSIGGRIEVRSTEGKGSLFRAVFPERSIPRPPPKPEGQNA